jgi:hypothetical protein
VIGIVARVEVSDSYTGTRIVASGEIGMRCIAVPQIRWSRRKLLILASCGRAPVCEGASLARLTVDAPSLQQVRFDEFHRADGGNTQAFADDRMSGVPWIAFREALHRREHVPRTLRRGTERVTRSDADKERPYVERSGCTET